MLLRNCTKLRDKNNPEEVKKIYVTPDLTPKEQKQSKALRSQLAEMNKDGKKFWIKNGKTVQRGNWIFPPARIVLYVRPTILRSATCQLMLEAL